MSNPQPSLPYPVNDKDESIEFKRYLSLFFSNWYWFAFTVFISFSISYAINRWSEKVYTVSSTILIRDDKFAVASSDLTNIFPGTSAFRSQQNLNNEIGILKSFNLNYRVIHELPEFHVEYVAVGKRGIVESRLYNQCPFKVVYDSLAIQKTGQKVSIKILSETRYRLEIDEGSDFSQELEFGQRFHEMGYDFSLEIRNKSKSIYESGSSNKYYFYFTNLASVANTYRSKLAVSPVEEEASLVRLTVSGSVASQEADYLNKLMSVYIEYGLELKNQIAGQTIDFINAQLKQISDSLRIVEGSLENFRNANKIIDVTREGSIIQDKFEKIDAEKNGLQMQENYYIYLKDYIDSKTESIDVIAPSFMGISDQLLIKLVNDLSQFQKDKRQLSMDLLESTAPFEILEANISRVRFAINENVNNGLQNIIRSKAEIDKRLDLVEQEARKLPSTERQMINIQRKFDLNNTVYTFLLEKRAEAGIAKASNVADNRVIDYAGSYDILRIKPREQRNFLLALILGLILPAIVISSIDYLNNKIIDKKDIEKGTNVPVLGFVSHNKLNDEIPVAIRPSSTLAESFRSVRTNLKYFLKEANCPVISVSSTISGEGKTFISANLTAIISSNDKKVLLAELDLRKPRFHKIFQTDKRSGLSTFLIGEDKFEDIVCETKIKNLWFVPSGPIPPNPAELIDSPAMKDFIDIAKKQFDYIVIDTPPIAIVTDALLLSSFTDFYVFVVRQRYSSKNTLGLIEELNRNGNIKKIGIIINDINLSGYYGYGLRYGNIFGYGYNYGYNYYDQYTKYGYTDSAKGYYKEEA